MKAILKLSQFRLQTVIVLAALSALTTTATASQAVWTAVVNTSADTNWSDLSNWQGGVNPSGNSCVFNDATGVGAGVINNVVNTSETPLSLTYTNIGTYQNTLILSGQTLTVGTSGLTMGNATALTANPTASPTTTISGSGTLIVSNNTVTLGYSFPSASGNVPILNMADLNTFIATNEARILIGEGSVRMSADLYLAASNYVYFTGASSPSSPNLDLGDNSSNNGPGSALYLGQTNIFYVNDIGIGLKKQNSGATMEFNSAFTGSGPVAYFYGTNGVGSRVSTWAIGDGQTTGGTITCQGLANFTGGTVNAMINSMWLGRDSTGASAGSEVNSGTLTFSAGTINVNNMTNGWVVATNYYPEVTGIINVNDTAVLSVNNNLVLAATNSGLNLSFATMEAQGEININGGTVEANQITTGGMGNSGNGVGAYIDMTGGALMVTNVLGTPTFPINYLYLAGSPTLQLAAASSVANAQIQNLYTLDGSTVTINISSMPLVLSYPTQYPLISYQGGSGSGINFALNSLPGTFTGYVSNDNSATVWLVITNGPALPKSDQWGGGVNDNWDTTTLNWTNNGVAVAYNEGDSVLFNDSAQSATVNLTAPHTPLLWTVTNNILNYTFTGSGVTGAVSLNKYGTASLILSESGDSFSDGISVNGGTVVLDQPSSSISGGLNIASGTTAQIGNNDANGMLPSGTLADSGTLAFDQTSSTLVSVAIPGTGGLTQEGSGTLALSAVNTYAGNTLVNSGTLALTNSGSISDSAAVNVNNSILDVSGVTGTAVLNNVSLANATINLSTAYRQSLVTVTNLSLGGSHNTVNVVSLPPIAYYPTTNVLIQSVNPIAGTDISLGTTPAASPSYTGSVSVNGNQVVLVLTGGPVSTRPYVTWSGADLPNLHTNWSDSFNWQTPGEPIPSDNVIFANGGAVSGTPFSSIGNGIGGITAPANINNLMDTSFTIGTLTYTNPGTFQNTLMANGTVLDVMSNGSLTIGSGSADFGAGLTNIATIAGATGTLNVNNTNGTMYVGMGDANSSTEQAILDMSGLGTFNSSVARVLIGVGSSSEGISLARESGVVYLAQTNVIVATEGVGGTESSDEGTNDLSIDVGDDDGDAGAANFLYLGRTNAIYAGAIGVGEQKAIGTMEFNPNFTSADIVPSAYFRGTNGGSVGVLSIGDGIGNSGTANCKGVCDFTTASGGSEGHVDALVGTLYVGRAANNASSSGQAVGILNFDNGIINAGTAYVGYQPASGTKSGIGTINVGTNSTLGVSGTLSVSGTLNLGLTTGGAGALTNVGTLNINGGAAEINKIVCGTGGGTNTISLNGGMLSITTTAGTTGAGLYALNLVGGILQLDVNGSAGVTNIVATNITTSGTTTLQIGSLSGVSTGVTYPLISYTGTDPYSSLSLVLPNGYAGNLVDNSGVVGLQLTTIPPSQPPSFSSISVSGTTLTLSGTNGVPGNSFVLLETTNLTPPVQWTPVFTNVYGINGTFNMSTNINPGVPNQFYLFTNLP